MKILLVSPNQDIEFAESSKVMKQYSKTKTLMMPLPLATIAALTPDDIEVKLWDEPVHGLIDENTELGEYDLVGISIYVSHVNRAKRISRVIRQRGIPVVIGGPGVSTVPDQCREDFDVLFIGEAELTWPQFIKDWKKGIFKKEYRQISKPDLSLAPIPRWKNIKDNIADYYSGAVQTTRGCPFDCEFCDVIYLFGRRSRHKQIEKILQEVKNLENMGMRRIFFSDDNFIGNRKFIKELLKQLVPLNNSFEDPCIFGTQVTINVAQDEELLTLLADANFGSVLIGVESPNRESLKEANKVLNYKTNLVDDLKRIQSFGISVAASMIVGFDHDDTYIFDQHYEFLQESCIPNPQMFMLHAHRGTKLWARLVNEERVINMGDKYAENPIGITNIIPKKMTRAELMEGYSNLLSKMRDWESFSARIKGFVSGITRKPNVTPVKRDMGMARGKFQEFLASLEDDSRCAIVDIIQHTFMIAPFMLEKVIEMIGRQLRATVMLPPLKEKLKKQIEHEQSDDCKMEIEQAQNFIPDNFKTTYKTIFQDLYQQVSDSLPDKTQTEEVLISIVTDFLIRWGQGFDRMEKYHHTYLQELVEKALEKEAEKDISVIDTPADNFSSNLLADEVLNAVDLQLRSL